MDTDQRLKQVEEISKNARTTWFSLIAALLFCGVTLLDVRDRDFFEYGAATQLPLIGVEVPVVGFFLSAPVLVLALYLYLHIYLTKLWRALAVLVAVGEGPPQDWIGADAPVVKAVPPDDKVYPWLLSDAALRLRPNAPKRDFGWLTGMVSWALGWAFAPFVLAVFWVRSWPYHHEGLTLFLGFLLTVSVWMWLRSRRRMRDWLRHGGMPPPGWRAVPRRLMALPVAAFALVIGVLGWETTEGNLHCPLRIVQNKPLKKVVIRPADQKQRLSCWLKYNGTKRFEQAEPPLASWVLALDNLRPYGPILETLRKNTGDFAAVLPETLKPDAPLLYPANLYRLSFVELPEDWQSRELAWQSYRRQNRATVIDELERARAVKEADAGAEGGEKAPEAIPEKDILKKLKAEFRKARAEAVTRLAKEDWQEVDLRRANLREAILPGLDLRKAKLEGAVLWRAQMEGAVLTRAQMEGAVLRGAQMEGAVLTLAQMEGAVLAQAQMEGAVLRGAQMEGAVLSWAQMEGAVLRSAQMEGADLSGAQMEGVELWRAQMAGAKLTSARVGNAKMTHASLVGADLRAVENLTIEQLRKIFGDKATKLPSDMEKLRPVHWAKNKIRPDQAFVRWRTWLIEIGGCIDRVHLSYHLLILACPQPKQILSKN